MDNPFPVIVVIGLTLFGLAFIADQEFNFSLGEEEENDQIVLIHENIGQIGDSQEDERTVRFENFTVGDLRGDIQVFLSEREEISNSLFSSQSIEFSYDATQPRDGKVEFEVLGKEGTGAVFVEVNGERVFEEAMISGNQPEIEIPEGYFRNGENNVKIGTNKGGIFSSSRYDLKDIEVEVNDRGFHDRREGFQMYDYELQDLRETMLTFSLESSIMNEPLDIEINNNTVFSEPITRVTGREVDVDPDEVNLNPGRNTIRFSTGQDSEYVFENAQFTVRYIGTTRQENVNVDFELSSGQKRFVDESDTVEELKFNYQNLLPSFREMTVTLNGEEHTFTPGNGPNAWTIPEDTLREGDNELTIESDGAYRMENLRIVSEREG